MKIGILGWGSLLWEGGKKFDRWRKDWRYDGPTLPIEFSRIASRRLGALTLVIDPDFGTPTVVAWCLSRRRVLKNAVRDLRLREDTPLQNIGTLSRSSNRAASASSVASELGLWMRGQRLDAIIWTALKSNFTEKRNEPFSVARAIAYLKSLSPEARTKAAEYVSHAPDFVKTPLRSALQAEPWFRTPLNSSNDM